jgi:hypothetical protein
MQFSCIQIEYIAAEIKKQVAARIAFYANDLTGLGPACN